MTIAHGFTLLFLIGTAYAAWHLWDARRREADVLDSLQNGLLLHIAVGDVRTALWNVILGVMFVVIVASPLFVEQMGVPVFRLVQQSAFILLGTVWVLGMAFSRIHQLKIPR